MQELLNRQDTLAIEPKKVVVQTWKVKYAKNLDIGRFMYERCNRNAEMKYANPVNWVPCSLR